MAFQLQMTWQPHLKKRKNGPPLGLKNLGNTCYLNSVLQCLTYTPALANLCLKSHHASLCNLAAQQDTKSECPFCLLEKRIARSLSVDLTLDTPGKIISGLRIFAEHFRFGRQEDAHEFLRYVIDACHNTCLRLKKLQQRKVVGNGGEGFGGGSVVKEIFGGALQSQVKCLACGAESNKVDEIMDISIDVLHSSSLKDAFQKFFQPEILDGNNKYKCDNCKKLVAARKQMSILQAPNVLVIQLKRFEGIFGGKIDKAITFEEVLVLSGFMCKASQDPQAEYNLFATIVHSGISPDSGHYYAYIKDAMGRWYCCNDSYVSLSTLQEVFSEKVYILFFSRCKQRPVMANKILSMNGTKVNGCNGNVTSKTPEAGHVSKSVGLQQYANHHSQKDNSTTSKPGKVPSSPQRKVISSGISGNGRFLGTVNGKIVVHRKESYEKNGDGKATICIEKSEKKMPLLEDGNGFSESKSLDAVNSEKKVPSPLINGNGEIQRKKSNSVANGCDHNGSAKASVYMAKSEKNMPLLEERNGFRQSKSVDAVNCENSQSLPLANENGEIQGNVANSVADGCDYNGTTNRMTVGRGSSYQEVQNGTVNGHPNNSGSNGNSEIQRSIHSVVDGCEHNGARNGMAVGRDSGCREVQNGTVKGHPDSSGPKRKQQEEGSCTIVAEDSQSLSKCKELTEALGKEASLFLRSSGWWDEVYGFMHYKKKLCAREAGSDALNTNELKSLLIADAKSTFISQIPESLKASLVKRLKCEFFSTIG